MELYEVLTYFRKRGHMTIADVAAKSGLPLSTLQKVFAGVVSDPNYSTVLRIAGALAVTAEDIAMMLGEVPRAVYSREALAMAAAYDALDEHGQRLMRLVAGEETTRVMRERPERPKRTV